MDIDVLLSTFIVKLLSHMSTLTANLIFILILLSWYIIILIPILYGFYKIRKLFIPNSRELKRLEDITRSLYNKFSCTLHGISIR